MPISSGTTISMFDISEHMTGKWDGKSGVRIQDGYLFQVEEEHQQNSMLWSIENKMVTKTLEQGFTIEVRSSPKGGTVITNPHDNPYLATLWEHEIGQAIKHRLRFGYCVIQMREIHDPFRKQAKREKIDIKREQTDDAVNSAYGRDVGYAEEFDMTAFYNAERSRLEEEDPGEPPDLTNPEVLGFKVPRVLDPLYECYVKCFPTASGKREYKAFARTSEADDAMPLPNTRVFVFMEPDFYGVPSSPFLSCFEDLQTIRGMLQRYEQRDYANTHPVFLYGSTAKASDGIIPSTTHINFSETGTETEAERAMAQPAGPWSGPVRMEDNSLAKKQAQLSASNAYMEAELKDTASKAVPVGWKPPQPKYNTQLEKLTRINLIDQFGPRRIIPEGMELSGNIPRNSHPADFKDVLFHFIHRIASATGIAPEALTGERATVGADVELQRADRDSAVRSVQRQIERMIAQLYVDIFTPIHKATISNSIARARYGARVQKLNESEAQQKQRGSLTADIAQLKQDILASTEADEAERLKTTRRGLKQQLAGIPELDLSQRMPWDKTLHSVGKRDEGGDQTGIEEEADELANADEYIQIRLESETRVLVHVRENPTLTYQDLRGLRADNVIADETFKKLSLRLHGLPEDYLATDAELDKDATTLAKRQKRTSDITGENDPKRAKSNDTDDKNATAGADTLGD